MNYISTQKLKPCIRCGAQQHIVLLNKKSNWACASCPDCWKEVYCERLDNESDESLIDRVIEKWNKRKFPRELVERLGYDAYKYAFKFFETAPFDWVIDNQEKSMKFFMNDYYKRFFYSIEIAELARSF